MAIKDYWVFQKRDVEKPWTFYIVKEYDKRAGKKATCIDYTFYHEDIPNTLHCDSEVCIHYDTVSGYVNHLICKILEYSTITSQDKKQLTDEIVKILTT